MTFKYSDFLSDSICDSLCDSLVCNALLDYEGKLPPIYGIKRTRNIFEKSFKQDNGLLNKKGQLMNKQGLLVKPGLSEDVYLDRFIEETSGDKRTDDQVWERSGIRLDCCKELGLEEFRKEIQEILKNNDLEEKDRREMLATLEQKKNSFLDGMSRQYAIRV